MHFFCGGGISKQKIISILIFVFLCAVIVINTNIPAFYFNDVTVNLATVLKSESGSHKLLGVGGLEILFYPFFLFFGGKWNIFRIYELSLAMSFFTGVILLFKNGKWTRAVLFFSILALGNIRYVVPGQTYFEAYRSIVWYGMFLFLAMFLASHVMGFNKKIGAILCAILSVAFLVSVFFPGSYIYDKIDLQEQLLTNFGEEMNVGNVVKNLSSPGDTLFLDGGQDMIYWESGLNSPYKYSWYTSVMPQIPLYKSARLSMFRENPPVFYYDFCSPRAPYHGNLPAFVKGSYQQLYSGKNPTCLYILKKKLPDITDKQWRKAHEGFFNLPKQSLN